MGILGVLPSPTREETESVPHDAPLPAGNTARSAEGSLKYNELMEVCTKLSTKVTTLEEDLKKTKILYNIAFSMMVTKMQNMKDEIKQLKGKRKAQIVDSSTSSNDGDSDDNLGDFPK
jgi:hypothetical protein